MQNRIILNNARYANAESKNLTPRISLSIDKNEISESQYNEMVNQYNVYLDEREACTKIRLTAEINLIASNVLFNRVTEIVKNEGGSDCSCLNFVNKQISTSYGKPTHYWGSDMVMATDDTQITYDGDNEKNYTYLCGIDIFNNHVLRANNKLPHYYYKSNDGTDNGNVFNTLSDVMCDENGFKFQSKVYTYTTNKKLHLYKKDDVMLLMDCIDKKLEDKDGWLGFVNSSKMNSFQTNGNTLGVNRVLNNEPVGKYIDLYPTRQHYQLMPYYNKLRKRYENNWEYCLLYPYSSTTENISCINPVLKTLQIAQIDENSLDDDDTYKTVIYSVAKHGLAVDDIIQIWRSTVDNTSHELAYEDIVVDTVIDDYTFSVYLPEQICKRWISIYDENDIQEQFSTYNTSTNSYISNGITYRAFNEYINFDIDTIDEIGSQNLSFAKVVNNEPCEYYVRIFSRFPNFDFATDNPTEEFAYSKDLSGTTNADKYADVKYEKTSTMTKLGYSKTAYNDNVVQIVFNDDINIAGLKDNLGRPLTTLYLSFMKTNYGHDRWYTNGDVANANIEHSHCFGRLNCGFKYNPSIVVEGYDVGNINAMNNVNGINGLDQTYLRASNVNDEEYKIFPLKDDEIAFDYQTYFYGDLCCYSSYNCLETLLQPICYRFNTQQRELESSHAMKSKFKTVKYQEIIADDYTSYNSNFYITSYNLDTNPTSCPEGYYYEPHYAIPIRTFSGNISEFNQSSLKIASLRYDGDIATIQTTEPNYINKTDRTFLYNITSGISIQCDVQNVLSTNVFTFSADTTIETGDTANYRVYAKPTSVPSYARISKDGSGILRWRNLCQNGFEDMTGIIEEYPFTNGCLYINKRINMFLKRQDPFGIFGLADDLGLTIMSGYPSSIENPDYADGLTSDSNDVGDDSYVNEKNGTC